ncbi:hypothetical protein C8Q80DRAFT_885422 [Daedaleopsis nitida]|nr:hypothetical protein C8Q80DRAFT_885422 [Daedaleopsis nitida]
MDTPASARRRKSQVFVQVPPSPYSTNSGKDDRADHPGNTPLKAVAMNVDNPPSPASRLKRKTMEESPAIKTKEDAQPPRPKKTKTDKSEKPDHPSKQDTASKKRTDSARTTEGDASHADQDLVRCHQCARKFDNSAALHCTLKRPNGQRCTFKYCRACLRNRYDLDLDVVKGKAPEAYADADSKDKHVGGVEYLFPCPRCSDICNCRACRKSKGLPATGNLKLAGRKVEKEGADGNIPAEDELSKESVKKTKTKIMPKEKGKAMESAINGKAATKEKKATKSTSQASSGVSKPHVLVPPSPYKITPPEHPTTKKPRATQTKPIAPPKPLPKPSWTILPTPLSRDAALERMSIREFLLRFAHIAEIAKSHLEELEELAVANAYTDSVDDEDEDVGEDRLVGWISEPALRAILVGFMNMFAKDADERDEDAAAFTKASQQLRASGANLNKIWSALATLRETTDLSFPDPPPPPTSATQRSTRTRESNQNTPLVVTTAQLVDVVAALAEAALETKPVQDDFDRAAEQEKDLARAARELSAAENARFKDLKSSDYKSFKLPDAPAKTKADKGDSSSNQNKAATKGVKIPLELRRAALSEHEALLAKYDCAHRIALAECIPRFGPLGRDTEGRVYYAITPGVTEREAAVDLLEGGKGEVKFGRRRVAELDERKQMKHWSWIVAIWGRKPDGAEVTKVHNRDVEGEDDGDDNAERWWAFWEPEEIKKLAEWLAMTHGINLDVKRPAKTSEELTVLDVDSADPEKKQEADKKSRGRPSNASSATGGSARTFASLNNSDSDSEFSEPEENDSKDDDDENGVDDDGDVQMRLDSRGEPVPTKKDLRALARGLKDYAELLEWRAKRAAKDDKVAVDVSTDKLDKGKGVERAPIPPSAFYGKR